MQFIVQEYWCLGEQTYEIKNFSFYTIYASTQLNFSCDLKFDAYVEIVETLFSYTVAQNGTLLRGIRF